IRLFDTDVGGASALEIAALRRRVRFIFQKHYLLRSLTALQNVIAGVVANAATDRHSNETRALGLLTALELGDHASKWPDQLSVGQQQRVAVAPLLVGLAGLLLSAAPTPPLGRKSGRLLLGPLRGTAPTQRCGGFISTPDAPTP